METAEREIEENEQAQEGVQTSITALQKEIHENGSAMANIRDNLRIRKLRRDIADIHRQINEFDMEELARAHRQFNEKYTAEKKRESDMESEVSFKFEM